MKSAMWRRAATRYITPTLPGTWNTSGTILYREPLDWLLTGLTMSTSRWSSQFYISAVVQLLAIPLNFVSGTYAAQLGHSGRRKLWEAPATVADAEPVMREINELVHTQALPFLNRLGTLPSFAAAAEQRAHDNPNDINDQERLFCIRLIQGDLDRAAHAVEATTHAAHTDGSPWALQVKDRVTRIAATAHHDPATAIQQLRHNATYTRSKIGLPPPPSPSPQEQ